MNLLLKPLSQVYQQVVEIKNGLFEKKALKSYRAPVPVISIGNMTMGGTGKTPIVDFCLKALVSEGKKVAVISRSYRADAEDPCWVDVSHPHAARYFGDESVMLAQANPEVDIYVGPTKWKTAEFAVSKKTYDLLIVDDGFQHRRLERDLDIVILDTTEDWQNYQVVPEGRAREAWHNLQRADLIILNKCNLASAEQMQTLQSHLPEGKAVLKFNYTTTKIKNLLSGELKNKTALRDRELFVFSALGRPEVFENTMSEWAGRPVQSERFRDHHRYSGKDVQQIVLDFKKSMADFLITTEKDAVKIKPLLEGQNFFWAALLEVTEVGEKGLLNEKIRSLLA